MDFLRRHKIDIFIFVIAIVVRLLVFGINLQAEGGNLVDTIHGDDGYYELSQWILEGDGLGKNALRTPVYPGFIAFLLFIFGSYAAVIGIQMLLGALIPVMGRHIALRVTTLPAVGLSVGIVLALEPYFALFSSIFYTETLFIFLFLAFILLFISHIERPRLSFVILSAFVLGIATLTKPTVQYLPILLVPLLIWGLRSVLHLRGRLTHAAVFIGVLILVLSPWFYRNYRAFGVVGMTAQPAYNLYVYLVPSVLSLENGTRFAEELKKNVPDDVASGNVITLSNGREYSREALSILKKHPKGLVLSGANSLVTFFSHDGMLMVLQHAGFSLPSLPKPAFSLLIHSPREFLDTMRHFVATPMLVILLARLFWIAVTVFFVLGSIMFVRRHGLSGKTVFAFIIILYFLVTTPLNGLGVNARFRMPVVPLILTFAAYPFFRKHEETLLSHSLL